MGVEQGHLYALIRTLFSELDRLQGLTIVTGLDHTVDNDFTGNQTIICTADLTVTLPLNPTDRDKIEVKANNFKITIDGNGVDIDGNSDIILRSRNTKTSTGVAMRYSAAANEWLLT